jgi:hypothetical protein
MFKIFVSKLFLFNILFSSITVFATTHPHGAELFHFKGEVLVKSSNGEFDKVEKGDLLVIGDLIKTGPKGLAIVRFSDNSTLRITPNSEVQIEDLIEPVEDQILGSTNIILKAGQLFINVINNQQAPVFHVKTSKVAMGVRGTRFFAGIDKTTGLTELAVNKGIVEISNPSIAGHKEAIEAGHGVHVEDGKFSMPQKYDWVNNLDYNTELKTINQAQTKSLHTKKREEFSKKRKNWVRDENKWNLHQQRWAKFKKQHESRALKLKKQRKRFKKNRKEFKSRKKSLMEKRGLLKLEAKNLGMQALRLKNNEKSLNEEISRLRTGRKNPRTKIKIAKKRTALKRDKKILHSKRAALNESRSKLKGQKKALIKEFKKKQKKASRFKARKFGHKIKFKKKSRRMKKRKKMIKKKIEQKRPSNSGAVGSGDSVKSL